MSIINLRIRPAILSAMVLLSGCATVPADRGLQDVQSLVTARGGPNAAVPTSGEDGLQAAALVENLLGNTLTAEDAVRITLVRNPRLRDVYARLGIASAEVLQAGRLSNPTFSVAALKPNVAGEATQLTLGLAQDFADLIMLPSRKRLAEGEFERVKAQVGGEIIALAAEVESAYYTLIGAQQLAAMRRSVARSAAASAELAQRFFDAGNITDLALSTERAAAAQAELELLSADAQVTAARTALNALMGLPASETRWGVPDRLPLPVDEEDDSARLQQLAVTNRLDLAAARKEVELLQASLDVTKSYRWLGAVQVGVERERGTDGAKITGPTLALQLPLFHQNQGGILRALAELERAQAELKALEIATSNAVALTSAKVRAARTAVELYRAKLVPLRERIVQRTQERVNYMFVGVFDLIRAKQEEYEAYRGYLEAVRGYWLARVELARAVGTQLPSSTKPSGETIGPEVVPQEPPMEHMNHGGQPMEGMPAMEGMSHPDQKAGDMKDMGDMNMEGMDMKDMPDMKGMDHDAESAHPAARSNKRTKSKPSLQEETTGHQHQHGDQP